MDTGSIAKHTDLGRGVILVTQAQCVVDNLRKLGIDSRFTVTAESNTINRNILFLKLLQHAPKVVAHLLGGGEDGVVTTITVPSTLAVDAVKITYLTLLRQEINTQRTTKSPAEYGSKNGSRNINIKVK